MTPARLAELLALAAARKARALAALEAAQGEDRALADELTALAETYARELAEGSTGAPFAVLGKRLAWADRRAAIVRAERARLAARIAAVRAEAAVGVGKHRALEVLLARAEATARQAAEARAERDAPPRA